MLIGVLLVTHIAVLGYWLGSELVINSTFRYVAWSAAMPFAERDRLMDHVMDMDQHVRYALILQAGLGAMLAGLLGYVPDGGALATLAALLALAWLALTETTHRLRKTPAGKTLAAADRTVRYLAVLGVAGLWGATLAGFTTLAPWLAWKLLLFGGIIACGLAIRGQLVRFYVTWREIELGGTTATIEGTIRRTYIAATAILALLWIFIGGIVILSLVKPM